MKFRFKEPFARLFPSTRFEQDPDVPTVEFPPEGDDAVEEQPQLCSAARPFRMMTVETRKRTKRKQVAPRTLYLTMSLMPVRKRTESVSFGKSDPRGWTENAIIILS